MQKQTNRGTGGMKPVYEEEMKHGSRQMEPITKGRRRKEGKRKGRVGEGGRKRRREVGRERERKTLNQSCVSH